MLVRRTELKSLLKQLSRFPAYGFFITDLPSTEPSPLERNLNDDFKPFSYCLHSLISALTHLRPLSFQAYIKNLRCLCSKVLRKVDGEVVNIGETGNPERKRAESGARLLYHVLLLPEFKRLGGKGLRGQEGQGTQHWDDSAPQNS